MPPIPKYNASKLFHKLAREAKNDWIKREGRKPNRDEWNKIQKWTSKNLYQDFKGRSYRTVKIQEIQKEVLFRVTPSEQRACGNVFALDQMDFLVIEWWAIWNKIAGLPMDVLIRVNASDNFGVTSIKHAGDMDHEEVSEIVENIREFLENKSGDTTFQGVVKEVPRVGKADPSNFCDYFLDFVLSDAEGLSDTDEGVTDFPDVETEELSETVKRQKEAERKIKRDRAEKIKKAKNKKKPTKIVKLDEKGKVIKKKKKKKKKSKAKDFGLALQALNQAREKKFITKKQYDTAFNKLLKKHGGVV